MMTRSSVIYTSLENYEETVLGPEKTLKMVAIDPGSYVMGGDKNDELGTKKDQSPKHRVYVEAFWMSDKEISWDIYQEFLYRENDHILADDYGDITLDIDGLSAATMPYVNFNKPGYPVIDVTQYAASMFCKWLSRKQGGFIGYPLKQNGNMPVAQGPLRLILLIQV